MSEMQLQEDTVMGRPQTNTVAYFPHMAKQGKTLFVLKNRFGNNGYAFWFQLLECLSCSEGHYYDCRDEEAWQYLLSVTGVGEVSGIEMLDLLAKMGKIDPQLWAGRVIWCQKLVDNLAEVYQNRKRSLPERPLRLLHDGGVSTVETPRPLIGAGITTPEIPQSRVEESKVEQSREISSHLNSVIELWRSKVPSLPKPELPLKMVSSRAKSLKTRWAESPDIEAFRQIFEKVEASDFLSGRNGKWTSCNIDWVLKPANWQKIKEGNYENKGGNYDNGATSRHPAGLPGNRPQGAFGDLEG